MDKRLFKLSTHAGDDAQGEDGGVLYFSNKPDARAVRDALTKTSGIPHYIARGPDHWRARWGTT